MRENGYKTDMGGKAECICAVSTEFLPLKFTQLITLILMKSRIEITSGKGGARRKRNMELREASGQHRAIVLSAIAVRFGEMVCAQNGLRSAKCTANDMVTTMSIAVQYIAGFVTVDSHVAQLVPFTLFGRLLPMRAVLSANHFVGRNFPKCWPDASLFNK